LGNFFLVRPGQVSPIESGKFSSKKSHWVGSSKLGHPPIYNGQKYALGQVWSSQGPSLNPSNLNQMASAKILTSVLKFNTQPLVRMIAVNHSYADRGQRLLVPDPGLIIILC